MKIDTLDALKDEEIQAIIARSNELLTERDRQRKDKALEQARAILSGAGLSLKDVASGKPGRNGNGKAATYHAGHQYQHPSNKTLTWNGKGQKPHWLRDIEAGGGKPIELA
jgi:DNA-binding protein H-NS